MRRVLIFLCISLYPSIAFCANSILDAYYEFGRRGAEALVEEEDLTDEFNYQKYTLKFSQKLKPDTSYYAKYQYYDKDYDTLQELDNLFNIAGFGFDIPIHSNDSLFIKIGPDFEFKEKLYGDAPNLNYDQIRFDLPFIFKKRSDWTIKLSGGINSYHYPHAPKDQLKINAKLEASKALADERWRLSGFYKLQHTTREKIANRLERTYGAAADIKLDMALVRSLEVGIEQGMDNTIIYDEARDDSFDYKYLNWNIKTRHSFSDKIKMNIKYTDLTRIYADFDHNFQGFVIDNDWVVKAFEVKGAELDMKLTYRYKQFRYPYVSSPYSFHNNNIFADAELVKKNDWKLTIGSDIRFYDYPSKRTNDKIYYIERIGVEKRLLKNDLTVGFDYRYIFKNFLHKPDIIEDIFRLYTNYRF